MADPQSFPSGNARQLTPDDISGHAFPSARKGLDPEAVRRFLGEVADQVRALRAERTELQIAAQRPPAPAPPPALDEATLTKALGEETTRVLQTARESAAAIASRAEARAAELLATSEELAISRRDEADSALRAAREQGAAEAASLIDRTKAECIEMIEEAREARRRVLADLAERRRTLLIQLEQIRVGKESMVSVIEAVAASVSESIESVRGQLAAAEDFAQLAAARTANELDATLAGGEDIDALVEQAISKLPSSGEEAVFTSFHGRAESEARRVFDIERERQLEEEKKRSPSTSSLETASGGAIAGRSSDERPARLPDRSPTASRAFSGPNENEGPDESFSGPRGEDGASEGLGREIDEETAQPGEASPVDELFAKIRASRETSVANAQRVLEDADGDLEAKLPARGRRRQHVTGDMKDDSVEEVSASDVVAEGSVPTEAEEAEPDPLRARRDALVDPAQRELSRALKRVLREEQNLLLDALRNRKKNDAAAAVSLDDPARARLLDAVLPGISLAQGAAGEFLRGTSSEEPDTGSVDLGDVKPVAERMVSEIVDVLNGRLASSEDGSSSDPADFAERIGAAFRDWRAARIEALAGDYVNEAFGAGALRYADAKKLKLSWRFDDAGSDCPDCDDNAMAGPVPAGAAFPTGHRHPPVHPGCRCFLFV